MSFFFFSAAALAFCLVANPSFTYVVKYPSGSSKISLILWLSNLSSIISVSMWIIRLKIKGNPYKSRQPCRLQLGTKPAYKIDIIYPLPCQTAFSSLPTTLTFSLGLMILNLLPESSSCLAIISLWNFSRVGRSIDKSLSIFLISRVILTSLGDFNKACWYLSLKRKRALICSVAHKNSVVSIIVFVLVT